MNATTIGFIGAGNMAGAIIGGVVRQGLLAPPQIGVYDISPEKCGQYSGEGFVVFAGIAELVAACNTIVLSVKPQNFTEVLAQVKQAMTADKLLISIAAGITADRIKHAVGFDCKLVLVMPNTPLLLGCGASALSRVEPTTPEEFAFAEKIFSAAGVAAQIDPARMSEIIPVNGSSPAFIYLFAKTIVDSAEQAGIGRDIANRLFCQTLIGSARMMTESGKTHQELIDMVCSPGGTTLAAMRALEEYGFTQAIQAAFAACVQRAKELAEPNA